jgi:hypothetical protein
MYVVCTDVPFQIITVMYRLCTYMYTRRGKTLFFVCDLCDAILLWLHTERCNRVRVARPQEKLRIPRL